MVVCFSHFWCFWVISLQKDGEEAVVVGNRDTLALISSLLQVSIQGYGVGVCMCTFVCVSVCICVCVYIIIILCVVPLYCTHIVKG